MLLKGTRHMTRHNKFYGPGHGGFARGLSLGAGLVVLVGPGYAEEDLIAIPAQCYERAITVGIPTQYQRESLIEQPVLVNKVAPDYPTTPTESRNFFCAAFSYSIDERGRASNIETLYDSHPGIDGVKFGRLARKALGQWRYTPGHVDRGPKKFIGFTAIFYKGFGRAAQIEHLRSEGGTASRAQGDIAENWQSYGKRVTQSEVDKLSEAERASQRYVEEANRRSDDLIPADKVHHPPELSSNPPQAAPVLPSEAPLAAQPPQSAQNLRVPSSPSARLPGQPNQPTPLFPPEDNEIIAFQETDVLFAPASTVSPPPTVLPSVPGAALSPLQSDLELEKVPVTDAFAKEEDALPWRK